MSNLPVEDSEIPSYVDALQDQRLKYTAEWYENMNAYDNDHFITLNREVGKVQMVPIRKAQFLQLPETSKQVDSFENMLLMSNPIFTIYPNDISDKDSIQEAKNLSLYLRQHYLDWDDSNLMHNFVHTAAIFPEAYWVFSIENKFNIETQRMEKVIVPIIEDPFDWLYDPRYRMEDNPLLIRIIRKPDYSIRNSKLYTGYQDSGFLEDFKEMFWNDRLNLRTIKNNLRPVMLYETYTLEQYGLRIKTITTDGVKIRDDFYKDLQFYPVVPLSLYSGNSYKPSFVGRLLPLNRSLDIIANRIEDYMVRFSRGQFQTIMGNETDMTDLNGIIHYQMQPLEEVNVPQMPPAVWQWFNMLLTLSERYGVNQAALGLSPRGSQNRSGKQGDQQLKGAGMQQKTPMDNLFHALKRIAEITVYFESELVSRPKSVTMHKGGGEYEKGLFIGEKFAKFYQDQFPDLISIPKSIKKLRVEMEDSANYTIEAKREEAIKLAGIIDKVNPTFQKILIDLYKVGNTADIIEDMEMDQSLLDNPEMKNLLANKDALPQDVKDGLVKLFQFLAQQSPVKAPEDLPGADAVKAAGGLKAPQQPIPNGQQTQGAPQEGKTQQQPPPPDNGGQSANQ